MQSKDGTRYSVFDNAVLDVKVHYADTNALYRLKHISKDNTSWGAAVTFVTIDKSLDGGETWVQLHGRGAANFENGQTGIKAHVVKNSNMQEIFTITLDWDKVNTGSNNADNYFISPNTYFFRTASSDSVDLLGEDLIASLDGRSLKVKHTLNSTENVIVEYNALKNNNFHEISKMTVQSKASNINDLTSGTVAFMNGTDWVSPYGLLADNNVVSDNAGGITVGGAHGTGGGTGFPTGEFGELVAVTIDGQPLTNIATRGKTLKVIVDHYISASNAINKTTGAKRRSIKERRTYTITSRSHKVQVDITALEDVTLTRYAGLQMIQPAYYTGLYLHDDVTNTVYVPGELASGFTIPQEKSFSKLDRAVLFNDKSMLIMMTDRAFGIGDGHLAPAHTETNPQAPIYITGGAFGKIYSHNLGKDNNSVALATNQTISYRGGYYFVENKSATDKLFTYSINGTEYNDDLR